MSNYKWTAEEEHLLKLLRATNTYREIAEQIARRADAKIPGFNIHRTEEAVRKKCDRDNITQENCKRYTTGNNPIRNHWQLLLELQKKYEYESEWRTTGIVDPGKITTKILFIADLHFPFSRIEVVRQIIEEHKDASGVVIGGDLMDGYAFSNFDKHKRVATLDEYHMAFALVKELSETFPWVVILKGNHDERASKVLKRQGIPSEGTEIFGPDLLARIANGEQLDATGMLVKRHNFSNVTYDVRDPWYVKIGKTIFCHPTSRGSAKPGWTVHRLHEQIFKHLFGSEDYDSIICAHTHKTYKGIIDRTLLVETGALTGLLGYAHKPDLRYSSGATTGYALVFQDKEGNTCFNYSGPIYLGESRPPKKTK